MSKKTDINENDLCRSNHVLLTRHQEIIRRMPERDVS